MEARTSAPDGRHVYLEDVALEVALARLWEVADREGLLAPLPGERLPLDACLGRVTAEPVLARLSSPRHDAAAMDGYAVRASLTRGATERTPVRLRLGDEAYPVDTGDPMPAGSDAVVMVEDVTLREAGTVEIEAPVGPWQHVRPLGEDIVASDLAIPIHAVLRPVDLGVAAAAGHNTLLVRRKPRVAIIPTGSELVPPGREPVGGQIIEFNSLVLDGMARERGADVRRLPIQPDDRAALESAVREAAAWADLVVVNAGSSAGSEDFTRHVLEAVGRVLVHGVAIKPGHPLIVGIVEGVPVLGIPGYPVSAALTFSLAGEPVLARLLGLPPGEPEVVEATLARKLVSAAGLEEFVRVSLGRVRGRLVASPLSRGAGVLSSLGDADGMLRVPRFSEGFPAGAGVPVMLLRPRGEIEQTILAVGSHDPALDVLGNWLRSRRSRQRLASSNVGSLGGLLALRDGEAHLAGTHLLDPATGEYNLPYLARLVPGVPVVLVTLAHRMQGFLVAPGNPRAVRNVADLAHSDIRFVNRQKGSGTRLLLDHELGRAGLEPGAIRGYDREEYTHLGVAGAVAGGTADAGLGILAAARALSLGFVPLAEERYDLAIAADVYESPLLHDLLSSLHSSGFAEQVRSLGGYRTDAMGQVRRLFN